MQSRARSFMSLTRVWPLAVLLAPLVDAAERDAPWHLVGAGAVQGHAAFWASDLLEGRAAATRGYGLAATYVAAQFRQYGRTPAGDAGTSLQHVPLSEAAPVLPGSSARLVRDSDTIEFEYGTDYLSQADFSSARSEEHTSEL